MAETGQVESTALQRTVPSGGGVVAEGSAGKAMAAVSSLRERVMALPAGKRTWLLASVAFVAAMCAAMA